MRLRGNITEAFRSLVSAKQRTVLALIGIVIGVGSVIAMITIGVITQKEVLKQFQEMGTDILVVQKTYGEAGGRRSRFRLEDALALPGTCPAVERVAPYVSLHDHVRIVGYDMSAPALGVTQSFKELNKLDMAAGRFISDLDGMMSYCVVGGELAEQIMEHVPPPLVGRKLVFKDRVFTVIGRLNRASMENLRPFEINEGIIIPVQVALRMAQQPELSSITVRLVSEVASETGRQQIEGFFAARSPDLSLSILSAEELIRQMQRQMQMFTLLLGAIGSISLVVGGVGVMNVMLVSVSERKREIGLRRAVGALRKDIQAQFLVESIVLCILGGFLGVGLGLGASFVVARISSWVFFVSYKAVLLGLGVSTVIGVFFGLYPARQAARLNPIQALREE